MHDEHISFSKATPPIMPNERVTISIKETLILMFSHIFHVFGLQILNYLSIKRFNANLMKWGTI